MAVLGWVRGRSRRAWAGAVGAMVAIGALALVVVTRDDAQEVVAGAESTSTTEEPTTSTTRATTTTTVATTTTTVAPTTTTAPPPTAPPTTAPPPTAPPTTMPAAPTEFRATVRGVDQGPDYYAIFHGTTFGAGGGFHVIAKCRSGTVRVTVLEDGWNGARPDMAPSYPTKVWVWADDTELAYNKTVSDGTVISGPVTAQVSVKTSGPSEHDMRVEYDCRG